MKPERIQTPEAPIAPDLREQRPTEIDGWTVDPTPNAIIRHFAQPTFAAAVSFLTKVAEEIDQHDRAPYIVIDGTGVTVRLGNPPASGVTECDLELAAALMKAA